MAFAEYFPIYDKLTKEEQAKLSARVIERQVEKGTLLHNGLGECLGLLVIKTGQLRVFITSEEGKEITLYRLVDHDICLLSASCVMNNIQFDITITAEKDTELWVISPDVYRELMDSSLPMANYTNQLMATRFTDVMWLVEQIMWKSFDKRLAAFLVEESALEEANVLKVTHETIANHLGSAREVVTRMLKYFQLEGLVKLTRGTIEITNMDGLIELSE